MNSESVIFAVLCQEFSCRLSIGEDEITLDSHLENDLGADEDDLSCVLIELQNILMPDCELVTNNAFLDCETVQDLIDTIIDLSSD